MTTPALPSWDEIAAAMERLQGMTDEPPGPYWVEDRSVYYEKVKGYLYQYDAEAEDRDRRIVADAALVVLEIQQRRGLTAIIMRYHDGSTRWLVRTEHGYDMPLGFVTREPHRGAFLHPWQAVLAAEEWLANRAKEHPCQ